MKAVNEQEVEARVERLLTGQPAAPPEARRVRRAFPVVERHQVSARHLGLTIEVDEEYAESLLRPGQYVTLKVSGWPPRFFVVASQQGRRWEFLVDQRGELGAALSHFEVGKTICMSLPEGGGFEPTQARGRTAAMFCTGSGVATMRPLIECWLAHPEWRPDKMVLYYGEMELDAFAYGALLEAWAKQGVEVHLAVEDGSGEGGHRYVQEAFDAAPLPAKDCVVYLSGAPVMIQKVADKMLRLGVSPSRVRTNI